MQRGTRDSYRSFLLDQFMKVQWLQEHGGVDELRVSKIVQLLDKQYFKMLSSERRSVTVGLTYTIVTSLEGEVVISIHACRSCVTGAALGLAFHDYDYSWKLVSTAADANKHMLQDLRVD